MATTGLGTAKAVAAGNAATAGFVGEIENEAVREALTAKGATAGKAALAAKGGAAGKAVAAGKGAGAAAKAGGVAKAATGGTMWTGKGLGLGLGLGGWGLVALGVVGALAVYGYVRSRQNGFDQTETDLEIQEALG